MSAGGGPSINSPRPSSLAREPRELTPSTGGSRGEVHDAFGSHRLIASEAQHDVAHDLLNKPSARILIETEVNGRVDLYQFIPFHRRAR